MELCSMNLTTSKRLKMANLIKTETIENMIFTVRGRQVMLDRDLANLYLVETKVLNQAVKRNIERFPQDFMFQLSKEEFENWKSQFVTSNSDKMGLRRPPYAFTEQGVSMLSAVLKSKVAIEVSVNIMRTFVEMKKMMLSNASIFQRLEKTEQKLLEHHENFQRVFEYLEKEEMPTQGIFFDGQIWDAYEFINKLLRNAKSEVILVDNYIDDTVLTLLKKYPKINFTVITKEINKKLKLDLEKYNAQYRNLKVRTSNKYHDRFLIIDDSVYHIGASLKDLGKKVFGFSKMKIDKILLGHSDE